MTGSTWFEILWEFQTPLEGHTWITNDRRPPTHSIPCVICSRLIVFAGAELEERRAAGQSTSTPCRYDGYHPPWPPGPWATYHPALQSMTDGADTPLISEPGPVTNSTPAPQTPAPAPVPPPAMTPPVPDPTPTPTPTPPPMPPPAAPQTLEETLAEFGSRLEAIEAHLRTELSLAAISAHITAIEKHLQERGFNPASP